MSDNLIILFGIPCLGLAILGLAIGIFKLLNIGHEVSWLSDFIDRNYK